MTPARRLIALLTVLAVGAFVLTPWTGFLPIVVGFLTICALALWDGWRLWTRTRPNPGWSAPSIVNLRRPAKVELVLATGVDALLAAPEGLGGNLSVLDGTATLHPRKRGVWPLGELWCFETSALRFWRRRTAVSLDTSIEVWPDLIEEAESAGMRDRGDGSAVKRGSTQSSLELRGLRPFMSGDDPRHVDWKATARHMHPVVREWEPERRRSVIFALDAGRMMWPRHRGESKFDASLRAVARVALAAGANGDRVGALVFDDAAVRFVPPLSGRGQAFQLLRGLNDLQPTLIASDFRAAVPYLLSHQRRALVIVMTDLSDPDEALELSEASRELLRTHLPFALLVRDPTAEEQLVRPVRTERDAYIRAAAELVLEDREEALSRLLAHGVDALEAPMDRLGARALNLYLRARERAAW